MGWNANLPLFADKFFEVFIDCITYSLIKFFFNYDSVELNEKSQDFTKFMTFLGFMQMTTLAQSTTNLVVQFVRIIFKILALYLHN